MKVLTFTSLFPNREHPNSAVFIKNRMAAVNRFTDADVRVVAPVPWFPRCIPGNGRWHKLAKVPHSETIDGLAVAHPRYLVTPKVGMALYGYSMFLGSLRTVKKIYDEWPFDVIDAHYVYPDGLAALLLGKVLGVPVVVSARGSDINQYLQIRTIKPLIKKVLTQSDRQISVCKSLADLMLEGGGDLQKISVIPNGINPDNFKGIPKALARQRLGLNVNSKILLTVGSLIKRKGQHLLIEALSLLKEQNRLDFNVFLVGHGPEKQRLQQLVTDAGLTDCVTFVGEVDNDRLADWYSAADLFFLGSSHEGWPNVVSEALACGTPVIATGVHGIPEIIVSSDYGMIVDRDPQAFAVAIQQAFQQPWERERISRFGQQRTWQVVAKEVYELFDTLLAQRQLLAGQAPS